LIFAAGNYAFRNDQFLRSAWNDTLWTLAALVVTMECVKTARYFGLRRSNAWNAFSVAGICWLSGMLIWSFQELILGHYTPFPGPADIGFLLYPIFIIAGFLLIRTKHNLKFQTLWKVSTLSVFFSAVLFVMVIFLFSDMKQNTDPSIFIASLYPLLYGVSFVYSVFLTINHWKSNLFIVFLLISLSMAAFVPTNIIYAAYLIKNIYLVGAYFDAFWIIALGFMAWAAYERRSLPISVETSPAFGLVAEVIVPVLCGVTGVLTLGVFFMQMEVASAPWLGFFAITFLIGNGLQKYSLLRSEADRAAEVQLANQKLKEGETRFRNLAELTADWFWETDMEQRFTYLTGSTVFEGAGLKAEDWIGKTRKVMHEAFTDQSIHNELQAYMDKGEPFYNVRRRFLHPTAGESWLTISGTPIRDINGNLTGYRGVGRNITAEERAHRKLQEQESLLRLIMESVPASVYLKDLSCRYLLVNQRHRSFIGVSDDIVEGKALRDLTDEPWGREFEEQDRQVIEAGKPLHFETQLTSAGGEERHFDVTKFPVYDADGALVAIGGINLEITDKLALERQLRQSQKLEAVGMLTGGIAHDFNNLLAVILLNVESLVEELRDAPDKLALAEGILEATERGSQLSHRLLAFSRKQDLKPRTLDVNERISGFRLLLARTLGENIEIKMLLDSHSWSAVVDPGQLENAILNLAINARDAMPNGGKIVIETRNVKIAPDEVLEGTDARAGRYICLSVSDTGEGMAPETLEKAFDPFFTTKETGKGTGLGLSMVYGFLKQSGGWASIYSEVGVGTTVRLYLPKADGDNDANENTSDDDLTIATGTETILVVEDNQLVRTSLVRRLKTLGYQVLEAGGGLEALDILRSEANVDLLFTDMIMPGLHGYELAKTARQMRPDIRVVFTTGFSGITDLEVHEELIGAKVLQKPYRMAELATLIRDVLDGGAEKS
jgi:PAS domain S-box-containing protein